jgi:ferritin-like metal-binding protein YciE
MPADTPKPYDSVALKQVLVHNLNRLYFSKCYLNGHLSHLIGRASFPALQMAMEEFWEDVQRQIKRLHLVYDLLKEVPSDKNCNPIKAIIKDGFCLDDDQDMDIFIDADIIAYLQLLEHINITTCRTLKMIASMLKNEQAEQLLTECFDESIDNDHLFLLISKEYFATEVQ